MKTVNILLCIVTIITAALADEQPAKLPAAIEKFLSSSWLSAENNKGTDEEAKQETLRQLSALEPILKSPEERAYVPRIRANLEENPRSGGVSEELLPTFQFSPKDAVRVTSEPDKTAPKGSASSSRFYLSSRSPLEIVADFKISFSDGATETRKFTLQWGLSATKIDFFSEKKQVKNIELIDAKFTNDKK
jgi:hypothetical protein